ncbi:hypothetical protein PPS11_20214 [Pseudomonas putida S11]|nr:hypothetical protein PPS11_20214 [Pseudomonas putida S11]
MNSSADWLDEAVERVAGGFGWLRDLVLGEFAEERPLSVVIADMLLSLVPGVVIVLSARDLAAVCLRLGKRYTADDSQAAAQPPQWQEWVLLVACLITLIAPIDRCRGGAVGTPVGSVAGALVGQEAAAFLRGLCLLLIRESQIILRTVVAFLGKFTRGSVEFWLRQVRFTSYEKDLLAYLNQFLTKVIAATAKLRSYLGNWPFNQAAAHLLGAAAGHGSPVLRGAGACSTGNPTGADATRRQAGQGAGTGQRSACAGCAGRGACA